MIFDILEKKLIDAGIAEPGKSLFRHSMPGECQVGVMVRSPLTGVDINPFIENWYQTEMQVITRHIDPVEGDILANRVARILSVNSLERHPETAEHGPAHITLFLPMSLPIRFPRLEGNGIEWSQHFNAAFGFIPK